MKQFHVDCLRAYENSVKNLNFDKSLSQCIDPSFLSKKSYTKNISFLTQVLYKKNIFNVISLIYEHSSWYAHKASSQTPRKCQEQKKNSKFIIA